MQIPATSAAASAASIAAQSTSKDSGADASQAAGDSLKANFNASVEKTGEANPDRDAQGQGDGLAGEKKSIIDEVDIEDIPDDRVSSTAPLLPDEPPSQLDILG